MKVLLVVDIQNDFTRGGSLEVPDGESIIETVNSLAGKFDLVVATQDWHPAGHLSFASSHPGRNAFETITLDGMEQVLWPDHCVQGTRGAELHPALKAEPIEAIFRKGTDPRIDSYSGLYDNGHLKSTGLAGYLRERRAQQVFVCGLAGDYCVYFTARDLLKEGFDTFLIEDATRPISADGFEKAKQVLRSMGGKIVNAGNL